MLFYIVIVGGLTGRSGLHHATTASSWSRGTVHYAPPATICSLHLQHSSATGSTESSRCSVSVRRAEVNPFGSLGLMDGNNRYQDNGQDDAACRLHHFCR